jgi:hypothetical protein
LHVIFVGKACAGASVLFFISVDTPKNRLPHTFLPKNRPKRQKNMSQRLAGFHTFAPETIKNRNTRL